MKINCPYCFGEMKKRTQSSCVVQMIATFLFIFGVLMTIMGGFIIGVPCILIGLAISTGKSVWRCKNCGSIIDRM